MKLLLVLLLAAVSAFSQVVVSVDQSVSKNSDKSWLIAMGSSALLPGMGELYLHGLPGTKPKKPAPEGA